MHGPTDLGIQRRCHAAARRHLVPHHRQRRAVPSTSRTSPPRPGRSEPGAPRRCPSRPISAQWCAAPGAHIGTLAFASRKARDERFSATEKDLATLLARWLGRELEERVASAGAGRPGVRRAGGTAAPARTRAGPGCAWHPRSRRRSRSDKGTSTPSTTPEADAAPAPKETAQRSSAEPPQRSRSRRARRLPKRPTRFGRVRRAQV